VWVW